MTGPDPVAAATWFIERGYKAFPVWGIGNDLACQCPKGKTCDNPGKHPATVRGFKDATTDVERVKTFLSNEGTHNYGLVPPPHIGVIDVDGEGRARWDALQLELGPLPVTLTTVTPNGFHYHFDFGDDPVPAHLHGFIVRSIEKGYIIGVGSRHHTGVYYDLLRPPKPIAKLPEAWKTERPSITAVLDGPVSIRVGGVQPESIAEGSRHDFLRDRARTLRGGGLEGEDLFNAVMALNRRFASPKSEEAVRQAIGDVETKFGPDPEPIYLNVPTTEEHQQQQRQEEQAKTLRTLLDLPFGTPPEPLVLGTFIAPEGWTVLYANGGTGKGLLALWMMRHVLFDNPEKRICVLDYEGHEWEWGNRARAIGWKDEELKRVIYVDPYDPVWKKGHTLAGIAPDLRRVMQGEDICLYVVDSYTTAAGSDSEMGGVRGAVEFFRGGAALGAPGLTLAHTSAGDERFPAKPFGSSFVHNLARETHAGAQVGSETGLVVPGLFGITATSIQVELRNKKRSVGGKTLASQLFDIEFRSNGDIRIDYTQNLERSLRDLILDVLATTSGSMTAKQMAAAIREDTGRDVDETTIRRTIDRGIDGLDEDNSTRPKTYRLQGV